jgi:hypothetical protein
MTCYSHIDCTYLDKGYFLTSMTVLRTHNVQFIKQTLEQHCGAPPYLHKGDTMANY